MLMIIVIVIVLCCRAAVYRKSTYYKITKNTLHSVWTDSGRTGEYLIYRELRHYEAQGARFLFNCYVPKDDGTTTEIDVLMLHPTGIYVFESKNYSGWIFGHERAKTWTQTLPGNSGRAHKEHFYNPILQNQGHIKWLKQYLNDENLPVCSVVVFSNRCTLKKVELISSEVLVINRRDLTACVGPKITSFPYWFSQYDLETIYEMLYPLSQTSDAEKQQHISNIRRYR